MMVDNLSPQARESAVGSDGFTVLEMIVSLLLFAFLLLLLPSTLQLGNRVWVSAESIERQNAVSALTERMREVLSEARPEFERFGARNLRLMFEGEAGHLSFMAPARSGPARGGVYRFEIARLGGDGKGLRFTQALDRDEGRRRDTPLDRVTAKRSLAKVSVSFRYFGPLPGKDASSGDGNGQWQENWRGRSELPRLVEITLHSTDHARLYLQQHVVALRLGQVDGGGRR